jgi:superfamily II DNA or RNA helicase
MSQLKLPKEVKLIIPISGNNFIYRIYGEENMIIDTDQVTIVSVSPFVFSFRNDKFFLSKSGNVEIPDDCKYAIQTRFNVKGKDFNQGIVECVRWLKHPVFNKDLTSEQIVSSWFGKFLYRKEDPQNKTAGLRSPQLGALYAFMSDAQNSFDRKIIVMPTGTGKTETMLSILIANQCQKVLVTVPSDALRSQLAEKFMTLGILKKFGVVAKDCELPYVGVVRSGMTTEEWRNMIVQSNIVVTTMPLLSSCTEEVRQILCNSFSQLFVDEAHHSEAPSWSTFIDSFEDSKVTMFTATPFRNDGCRLRGKFIFSFSLKNAQEQGYYKPIEFHPIREYDRKKADKKIAKEAVSILHRDLKKGYDHILMARCSTCKRAQEVFAYYSRYQEYNPILIYNSCPQKNKLIEEIRAKKHRIIVCVNMLGEGFDLPEMKIAAIHDERQSIPITLQFIGRFTRTSFDNRLGKASFITNLAYPPIIHELEQLYSMDSDWNELLPLLNDEKNKKEFDFNKFISGFRNLDKSKIPFQQIRPALSTLIYNVISKEWNPLQWDSSIPKDLYDYKFMSTNEDGNTIVIVLGQIVKVEWGIIKSIHDLRWDIVIIHRRITPKYKHVYVNSSNYNIGIEEILKNICGDKIQKVSGDIMFRALNGVKRFFVMNFGGRKRPGAITFKSYYGKDVDEGLNLFERKQLLKNNIFGTGYRDGERTSIGCSKKGKVWSYMRGDVLQFCKWSEMIGAKIADSTIDPNTILDNTLKVKLIKECPKAIPIVIDWDCTFYDVVASRIFISDHPFWEVDLDLADYSEMSNDLRFIISVDNEKSVYSITYGVDENGLSKYKVRQVSGPVLVLTLGSSTYSNITEYFNQEDSVPSIGFADGSSLFGVNMIKNPSPIIPFDINRLKIFNWNGVDLSKESQGEAPYIRDSIQYKFAGFMKTKYDILYDDDGSGEIADLIGIKVENDAYDIHLYHLKFAANGKISNSIGNFYAVCGQAEKSLKWHDNDRSKEFVDRMFARINGHDGNRSSRLLKGKVEDLDKMKQEISWKKMVKFHINIVQPALSKKNANRAPDILNLLGITDSYLKDYGNVDFNVYCSE